MNQSPQNPNELRQLRLEMDRIDRELARLFVERMETAAHLAEFKRLSGKPVYDPAREEEKLRSAAELTGSELGGYARRVWACLMEVSRDYQKEQLGAPSPLVEELLRAVERTPSAFPTEAVVACQGTEGAFSAAAARKLFPSPIIRYEETFEDVLRAVEAGSARYAILPAENSAAGPVSAVWKLFETHELEAVRAARVKVAHSLLVNPGVRLSEVREIVSHEQALRQCGNFLESLGDVKLTAVPNTAVAAREVRDSGRTDLAAVSSEVCAELYGLTAAARNIQNTDCNYTRFLCLSKEREIYPGANKTSVMLVTPNQPGALYRVLSRFQSRGVNLTFLRSQPIEGTDFEFRFFLDFETPVPSPDFLKLMQTLADECEEFRWLGSYTEL